MGNYKAAVFIASRADEFCELRAELVNQLTQTTLLAPVDLNDGQARHSPPIAERLSRVRASDLMVLLLGDGYGPDAPGHGRSLTHVEYDEAVREGSKTRVLVYRVRGAGSPTSERPLPPEWLLELEEKHTLVPLERDDVRNLANEILTHLLTALYDLRFGEVFEDDESIGDVEAPDEASDGAEHERLEEMEAQEQKIDETRPAALAAAEQRAEAEHAIELGEYGIAIQHLRRALAHRPLDGASCVLLARLYVVLGRRDRLGEAVNLAERAARIAANADKRYRGGAAYLLAAQAQTALGDVGAALATVDRAIELRGDFAKAHLQRARVFCAERKPKEAMAAVRAAVHLENSSAVRALRDPHLNAIRGVIQDFLRDEAGRWLHDVIRIIAVERTLCEIAGRGLPPSQPIENAALETLRSCGRDSIDRQHQIVVQLLRDASQIVRASQPGSTAYGAAVSKVQTVERLLQAARDEESSWEQEEIAYRKWPWITLLCFLAAALTFYYSFSTFGYSFSMVVPVAFIGGGLWALRARLQRFRVIRASLTGATRRRKAIDATFAATRKELDALGGAGDDARDRARKALDVFEQGSLQMPSRYQPFVSLRKASVSAVVRVSPKTLEQYVNDYSRRVERSDAQWWLDDALMPDRFALYKVASVAPHAIRLSRSLAYEP